MSEARIVAELTKNAMEVVRVTLDTYQSKPIAEARVLGWIVDAGDRAKRPGA